MKERWIAKDPVLVEGMAALAALADEAVACLHRNDVIGLCQLVDKNFALRRQLYGDDVVGRRNVAVAQLAGEKLGLAAKFTGSGGAFVLIRRDGSGW